MKKNLPANNIERLEENVTKYYNSVIFYSF